MLRLPHLLLLTVLLSASVAQSTPTELTARALFDAAKTKQCPDGSAPEISDFHASMSISLYETEKAGPKTGQCVQYWQRATPRARYHRILTVSGGKTTHLATDGLRFLLWEEGGRVQDLLEDPTLKDDLRTLRAELHRTEELLGSFFLQQLDGAATTLEFCGPPETARRGEPAEDIAVRRIACKRTGKANVVLTVGLNDQRLYAVEHAATAAHPAQSFRFDFHAPSTGTKDGKEYRLLLPRRVEYIEDGKLVLEANARKASDLRFNSGLDAKLFAPPK
jgi:hypothetical protein